MEYQIDKQWSIPDIKLELQARGVTFHSLIERQELIQLLNESRIGQEYIHLHEESKIKLLLTYKKLDGEVQIFNAQSLIKNSYGDFRRNAYLTRGMTRFTYL